MSFKASVLPVQSQCWKERLQYCGTSLKILHPHIQALPQPPHTGTHSLSPGNLRVPSLSPLQFSQCSSLDIPLLCRLLPSRSQPFPPTPEPLVSVSALVSQSSVLLDHSPSFWTVRGDVGLASHSFSLCSDVALRTRVRQSSS